MGKLQKERPKWPTAVWKICSQTTLRSPYRVWHSEKCGTKSSICPPKRIDGAHRSVLAGMKKRKMMGLKMTTEFRWLPTAITKNEVNKGK